MAERPMCANEDHVRPVSAVARITWPDGHYKPTTGCAGCRDALFSEAMREGRPILIEPIPEAYGTCPVCHATVLLRGDGTVRAHASIFLTCKGWGQKPKEATR